MVTRRTMLKAAAAAMIGVRVELRPTLADERLLLPFCLAEPARWEMAEPFGVGAFTYATDSRAMVRAELSARKEIGERNIPPVEKAWREFFVPGDWRPFHSSMLEPTLRPIDECGSGPCPRCGSAATVDVVDDVSTLNVERGCELERIGLDVDAWKVRDVNCPVCGGLNYDGNWCSQVCGVVLATCDLWRIAALPNVRVCRSRSDDSALLFRADGFEGVSLGIIGLHEENERRLRKAVSTWRKEVR